MIPGSLTAQREVERLTAENTALRAKVARVEALLDEWVRKAGPGSRAADVFGPQKVSVEFAFKQVRAALAGESDGQ